MHDKLYLGPATIETSGGTTILVGVAAYVWKNCGPGVNNGLGTFKDDAANYVDIYKYMKWIEETMNGKAHITKILVKHLPICGKFCFIHYVYKIPYCIQVSIL